MILSNLKQTLRVLFKEKRITIINIAGLSVSLACALLMLLWVENEMSYDRFHNGFKQLYRVEEDQEYHYNISGVLEKLPGNRCFLLPCGLFSPYSIMPSEQQGPTRWRL